jgi:formylglycine-generating enzyme required for sulfatase activity
MLRAGVLPCVPILTNSIGMQLALIPPGHFWLGSPMTESGRYADESPRRLIELTRPFYLGVYPVTQEEYRRVMKASPSAFSPTGSHAANVVGLDTGRFPVEEITWSDAVAFCTALSKRAAERKAKRVYRLPAEVEWEYACRGGAAMTTPFPHGKRMTSRYANFNDFNARSKRPRQLGRTSEVGSYLPNGFGLYDMVGNVWEWCADWYVPDAYANHPPIDPPPAPEGDRHNARGGPWSQELRRVRSADRSSFEPEHHDCDCGMRVLCEWRG